MKEIQLSQTGKHKGKYVALVDDQDYEFLNQWKWSAHKDGNTFYAQRTEYNPKRNVSMHRLIMGTDDNMQVDHRDGNGLNNVRSNLRNCTKSQNQWNRKSYGTSKYLGVYKRGLKFRARISTNKIQIGLGTFKTEEEAALAYDLMAKKLHGEFSNFNFK